ncbi:hypothetical protein C3L33_18347, partial [Rhododendron williamsianum]
MRLGICSRTNDVVEPLIKSQWYVRCNSMAKQALDAVFDEENKKMEIILRQYAAEWKRGDELKELGAYNDHWVVDRTEEEAWTEASGIFSCKEMKEFQLAQDPDVLDTWFSSGLFPLTVLGWPDDTDDLKAFYPTSVLETGHDILFFWVARMVMLGFKLGGDVPFRKVYLHPVICDAHGRKMSKSLGNVIDPLEVINGITLEGLQKRLEEAIWIQQNWKLQKTDKERTSLMVFLNAVLMLCILPLSLTQLSAFLHLGIVICTRKDSIMLCEYPSVVECWANDRVESEMDMVESAALVAVLVSRDPPSSVAIRFVDVETFSDCTVYAVLRNRSLTLQPHPTTTAAAGTPLPKPIFVIHYASISNSTDDNCLFAVELKSVTAVLRHCPNCNFPKLKSVTSIYTHVIPALALVFGSGNAEHVEGLFQLVFEGWGCVALFVLHM